jgi:large subunit ribosomal protein L6
MITIPQGVTVSVSNGIISVKGPKGKTERQVGDFAQVTVSGENIDVKGEKAFLNTMESLIANMIKGVSVGYQKELKLIYAHFPITLEVKGKDVAIKNFLGEKMARKAKLIGDTKLSVKAQFVTVTGSDKEAIGQSVANLRQAMRIRDKDGRIFQDGIYPIDVA